MPVAPATIVRTKRSWPGTSTTDSAPPARQPQRRVAERDRDPARAAPPAAGRCRRPVSAATSAVLPWSMWPAVPSVSGALVPAPVAARGDRDARRGVGLLVGERARVEQQRGRPAMRADERRVAGAQRARRARRRRPGRGRARRPGPPSSSSGSAPPPTARPRPRRPSPPVASARRCARSREARRRRRRASPAPGSRAARARGRGSRRASPRARRARACRSARRAPAGGGGRRRSRRARRRCSPACGPPSSLSPEKQTSAAPARTERRTGGSSASALEVVGEHARADVVDHRRRRARTAPRSRPPRRSRRVRKFDGWARRIAPVSSPIARARSRRAACGSWCRPRPAARRPGR